MCLTIKLKVACMYWKDRCINFNESLTAALRLLQKAEGKVLYAVDENFHLKGTITDGDLRRFLIDRDKTQLIKFRVIDAMNTEFHFERIGELFHDDFFETRSLKEITLCDHDGCIGDVLFMSKEDYIPIAAPSLGIIEKKFLNECFDSEFISSNSSMVSAFERAFLDTIGAEFGTSVSNGTVALELVIKSLGLKSGACIGVPNYTFAASINAIINCGYIPIILDCTKDLLIDETKVPWQAIDVLIYVSLYGNAMNLKLIRDMALKHNVFLIGDHAEGLGCMLEGQDLSTYCDASSYSFFANKLITTGEGGFVVFNEKNILDRALVIKNHGMNPLVKYNHIEIGSNYRITGLQAAIGLGQLSKFSTFLRSRRDIGLAYQGAFKNFRKFSMIETKTKFHSGSFWLFPLIMQEQLIDSLETMLIEHGIEVRRLFQPLSEMPIYRDFVISDVEYLKVKGVVLPTHPSLSRSQITKIINVINKWERQLQ